MTKTILILAIASVLVAGALAVVPAVYAPSENSPANGGIPPGLPFQNLQEEIDDIDALLQAEIDDLQSQIDDLQAQIDSNDGDISTLQGQVASLQAQLALKQSLITGSCPPGSSIRQVFPNGAVACEFDNVSTSGNIQRFMAFAPTISQGPNTGFNSNVQCSSGFTAVACGFDTTSGVEIDRTFLSGNGCQAIGNSLNGQTGGAFRANVVCMRIL